MKHQAQIFNISQTDVRQSRGGMLMELLLSVALASVALPFLFQYQQNALRRAENVVVTRQMGQIQTTLERYIVDNREKLLRAVGRNITRIEMSQLAPYGLPDEILENSDKYQIRILKSTETGGKSTLQGVIVMSVDNMNPLRTREIVALGGGDMGFIEGNRAYGSFGTWHTNTADIGVNLTDGIIEKTAVNRDNALYLRRVPSDDASDATMMGPLNLGGHDITSAAFLNASNAVFDETISVGEISTDNVIFKNRTVIDRDFVTQSSTVSGALSSDSRTMDIAGTLTVQDLGKFSAITTDDLWVTNLSLSGLSVSSDNGIPILNTTQSVNMTSGRISAMSTTVGFSGSITPRLTVSQRIEDSTNSAFYWDAQSRAANFVDATFAELNRMAPLALNMSGGRGTVSYQIFASIAANKNATVAEYMNAISEIETKVRAKYRQLNLE